MELNISLSIYEEIGTEYRGLSFGLTDDTAVLHVDDSPHFIDSEKVDLMEAIKKLIKDSKFVIGDFPDIRIFGVQINYYTEGVTTIAVSDELGAVHVHDYGATQIPCSRPECAPKQTE